MGAFTLKVGDRLPVLAVTLLGPDGNPVDLTTATGVTFRMTAEGAAEPTVAAGACTIASATGGRVEYAWAAVDVDTAGNYNGEFVVAWTGGKQQTVPNEGTFRIRILATLE